MHAGAHHTTDELEKLFDSIRALKNQKKYVEARIKLLQFTELEQAGNFIMNATQRAHLINCLWELSPVWWSTVRHGSLSLRRCSPSDAHFLTACYQNQEFAQNFNRQKAWFGDLSKALYCYGTAPPLELGMLQWIVCLHGQPIGLASLSCLDQTNMKAEFSIGFPAAPPAGIGHKASLMAMHFGFFLINLNKLYTYVYADNVRAASLTERLGFRKEGVFHDHFHIPPYGYVDINAFGLTRNQAQRTRVLLRAAKRLIGQDWSPKE